MYSKPCQTMIRAPTATAAPPTISSPSAFTPIPVRADAKAEGELIVGGAEQEEATEPCGPGVRLVQPVQWMVVKPVLHW